MRETRDHDTDEPRNLLAKSPRYDESGNLQEGCLLVRHTLDVVAAANKIVEVLKHDLQRFFKLSETEIAQLDATVKIAAFFHDIGKANDGFNAMLWKRGKQAIRHEHLSALLMSYGPMREWLTPNNKGEEMVKPDYQIARLVVSGYHLKTALRENMDPRFSGFAQKLAGALTDKVVVYSRHRQFDEWLDKLAEEFSLPSRNFEVPSLWSFLSGAANKAERIHKHGTRIVAEFSMLCDEITSEIEKEDWSRMRLWMAVKSVLIAADAAASAMRRKGLPLDDWIESSLSVCANVNDLEELKTKYKTTLEARIRKRKGQENYTFSERQIQAETAKLPERAALVSSCGSGKTYAGYLWAQKQIEKTGQGRKVMFLYPTTNTAAQGFKDYASHDSKATLITSRSEFDLEGMFKNPDDEQDDRQRNDYTTDKKLFALGHWDRSICVATVDAFLSFMQNGYASLCLLPALTRGIVVIDEVHSFDYGMFAALVEFLERFDVPVLLMSASIPEERRHRLSSTISEDRFCPKDEDLAEKLTDLRDAMNLDRYEIQYDRSAWETSKDTFCPESFLQKARNISRDQKVLWVVNTVDRCIGIARALEQTGVYCYHSRFVYEDRRNIHDAIVEKLQPENKCGAIAVTTQVCEMSLDLDADILITELAPATSLIQRMGRCNRQEKGREDGPGQVFVYNPPSKHGRVSRNPYRPELFQTGEELMTKLAANADISVVMSQRKLADILKDIGKVDEPNKLCKFTKPDWVSTSENDFREIDEFSVPAVLENMKDEFFRRKRLRESVAGILIQAPVRYTENMPNTWVRLVPTITKSDQYEYSKTFGLSKK
jgi:CRISPR-associated endonuclease/helicase Cas3